MPTRRGFFRTCIGAPIAAAAGLTVKDALPAIPLSLRAALSPLAASKDRMFEIPITVSKHMPPNTIMLLNRDLWE